MKFRNLSFIAASFALLSFIACNNSGTKAAANDKTDTAATAKGPITISPVEGSPEFPEAELSIKNVSSAMEGKDSVKVTFDYGVKNYELTHQTADAATKECSNSMKGQHIHFILDNKPYAALYKPTHSFTVLLNSEHYVMSFLSRSYHESLKTPKAGVLYHFSVDGKGKVTKMDIPKTPMIFYSRPKGHYMGADTKKVLLDFYAYNATLGTDALVKATINGTDFVINKWQPYFIENAPMGAVDIKLQLTDMDGKALEGENTSVSRSIHLMAGSDME
jgi:hypothetical protein